MVRAPGQGLLARRGRSDGSGGTLRERSSRMMCARSERARERGGSAAELGRCGCSPSVGRPRVTEVRVLCRASDFDGVYTGHVIKNTAWGTYRRI